MKISSTLTIGVTGNVWDAVKGVSLKTLVIAGGKIIRIMDGQQNVPGATMITLGITGTGAIAEGYDADLFVLRKANASDDALTALLACSDSDIEFVMVNGRVVFGLTTYFTNSLRVDYQGFPVYQGNIKALKMQLEKLYGA